MRILASAITQKVMSFHPWGNALQMFITIIINDEVHFEILNERYNTSTFMNFITGTICCSLVLNSM